MFSHVMLGADDVAASKKFYDAALGALGIAEGFTDPKGRVFYRSKTGVFALSKPIDGKAACAANGGTVGFAAADTAAVDAWHKAGLAHGGTAIEDPPGVRGQRLHEPLHRLSARSRRQQGLRHVPDAGCLMSLAIPTLETERLILRAWRAQDGAPFAEMCADAELMRFVGGVLDQTAAFRRMADYAGHWVIYGYGGFALEAKSDGDLVGYCGINDPPGFPEREINWGLRRAHLGHGYITEAARRVRDYAYADLGFTTIASCIDRENAASIAVANRLGATLERTVDFRGRPMGVFRHLGPDLSLTRSTASTSTPAIPIT